MSERTVTVRWAERAERVMAEIEGVAYAVVGRAASWVMVLPVSIVNAVTLTQVVPEMTYPLALGSTLALEMVGVSVTSLWLETERYEATRSQQDAAAHPKLLLAGAIGQAAIDLVLTGALVALRWSTAGPATLVLLAFPTVNAINTFTLAERVKHAKRLTDREDRLAELAALRAGKKAQPQAVVADSVVDNAPARPPVVKETDEVAAILDGLAARGYVIDRPAVNALVASVRQHRQNGGFDKAAWRTLTSEVAEVADIEPAIVVALTGAAERTVSRWRAESN